MCLLGHSPPKLLWNVCCTYYSQSKCNLSLTYKSYKKWIVWLNNRHHCLVWDFILSWAPVLSAGNYQWALHCNILSLHFSCTTTWYLVTTTTTPKHFQPLRYPFPAWPICNPPHIPHHSRQGCTGLHAWGVHWTWLWVLPKSCQHSLIYGQHDDSGMCSKSCSWVYAVSSNRIVLFGQHCLPSGSHVCSGIANLLGCNSSTCWYWRWMLFRWLLLQWII